MSAAPDTPSTPPQALPANRGSLWTRNPSHSTRSRATRPPATSGSRSLISRLHRHVGRRLRLAGEDDVVLLVPRLQPVLDGHRHAAGEQLDPAGPTGAD